MRVLWREERTAKGVLAPHDGVLLTLRDGAASRGAGEIGHGSGQNGRGMGRMSKGWAGVGEWVVVSLVARWRGEIKWLMKEAFELV